MYAARFAPACSRKTPASEEESAFRSACIPERLGAIDALRSSIGESRTDYGVPGRFVVVRTGIVQREMEPSALLARQGRADDQIGYDDKVAQFQQITGDSEISVILGDFLFQQVDTPQRPLQ